jgi:hypothetical protein
MSKGQALAQQHKCLFCHGTDLAGGQQVPRIGGQREDYLQMSPARLQDRHASPGYTQGDDRGGQPDPDRGPRRPRLLRRPACLAPAAK